MRVFILLTLVVVFSSCVRNKTGVVLENDAVAPKNVFEVVEIVEANSYSYLKVNENSSEKWVAVTKQEIKVGDVFYYDEAYQMLNFKSKDLDRTFEEVYFVNQISKEPFEQKKMDLSAMHQGKIATGNAEIAMEKAEGELTLSKVFENKKDYSAKGFEIRGKVVKVTPLVMGKNWIHIQDGTSYKGSFDLTVTTKAEGLSMGDEVVFKGKLSLNKDFGHGYSYDVIMEDAKLESKTESVKSL